MESNTSKEQSIEQALRRLKYLHTSLVLHGAFSKQHGYNVGERIITSTRLQSTNKERFRTTEWGSEKRCFLSLQPNTSNPFGEKTKRRILKCNQAQKALRTGRAPLRVSRSVSVTEEQLDSTNVNGIILRDVEVRERRRTSKSASSGPCFIDPYKCLNTFTYGFDGNTRNKKVTKDYSTNMKINRVTFSARPSGRKDKSMHENEIEVPKSCFFNGWGVRSKKVHLPKRNTGDDSERHTTVGAIDIAAGIKTLRLDPKRVQQGYHERTIPQPPPTPVRQIDIRLPQGKMVKYQLPEDE